MSRRRSEKTKPIDECAREIGRERALERYEPPTLAEIVRGYLYRGLRVVASWLTVAFPVVLVGAVLAAMPQSTLSVNGESTPFPPEPIAGWIFSMLIFVTLAWATIKYAPGMVGGRR